MIGLKAGPTRIAPPVVVAVLVAWCAVHLTLRLALVDVMEVDHVEQAVAAQGFALSYGPRQPPLYTWLQLAAFEAFGVGQIAFVALKYALVAAFLLLYYGAARRLGMRGDVAALTVFSLSLLYQVGWKFHFGVTHTLLLSVAVAGAPFALAGALERPTPGRWALVGIVLGIGLMAKYGFAAYLLAFVCATAAVPTMRRAVSRAGLAAATGALVVTAAPIAVFVAGRLGTVGAVYETTLTRGDPSIGEGLLALALALAGFLAPLLVVVPAIYPRAFHAPVGESTTVSANSADWDRWFRVFHVTIALILLGLVLFGGLAQFKERWMHPFALLIPLWWFLRIDALYRQARRRHRTLLAIIIAWSVFVLGYRIALDSIGPPLCSGCRQFTPYSHLEDALEPRADEFVSFLVVDEHLAGNLRVRFPDHAVFTPRYPQLSPERFGFDRGGACALVWRAGKRPPPALTGDLWDRFGTRFPETTQIERVAVPLTVWRRRFPRWRADTPEPGAAFVWHYAVVRGCGAASPQARERTGQSSAADQPSRRSQLR